MFISVKLLYLSKIAFIKPSDGKVSTWKITVDYN